MQTVAPLRRSPNLIRGTCGSLLVFVLAGCATQSRVNQFSDFATAGQAYLQAADQLIDETAVATVAVGSTSLIQHRNIEDSSPDAQLLRLQNVRRQRQSDIRLIEQLLKIKMHNKVLHTYFEGLEELASNSAATEIATSATNAASALSGLGVELSGISIGSATVGDFIEPGLTYGVRQLTHRALQKELEVRGNAIHAELELQRAAMMAIGAWMIELKKTQQSVLEDAAVFSPYASNAVLPDDWSEKRRQFIMAEFSTIETIQKAETAARKLRDAFADLSESRSSLTDFLSILEDANQVATLLGVEQS
jgi:hypothetical protein